MRAIDNYLRMRLLAQWDWVWGWGWVWDWDVVAAAFNHRHCFLTYICEEKRKTKERLITLDAVLEFFRYCFLYEDILRRFC